MAGIADTINRHNPDIISLQEFVLTYEVKKFMKRLDKKYQVIYLKRKGMMSCPSTYDTKSVLI